MAKQNTAPTMKDVAKEAGVSLGTVSKVINGIPVGDEYRKKVEQAIKTLDYHINAYAKGLKNNRTYTVAVILPNLLNPFFSMVAHYINRALVNRGYRMLLCDTEYDYTKEQEMVQMVAQNKVDGIIALTYNPDLKIPPDVRSVSIDRYLSGSTTCVASDNYNGGRLAAQKLVENGKLKTNPMKGMVAAVSVGIVNGEAVCDLEYVEDSAAETDMNVVMTEDGRIIEVQGTAEGEPFTHEELLTLLALARGGIESIVATQKAALAN